MGKSRNPKRQSKAYALKFPLRFFSLDKPKVPLCERLRLPYECGLVVTIDRTRCIELLKTLSRETLIKFQSIWDGYIVCWSILFPEGVLGAPVNRRSSLVFQGIYRVFLWCLKTIHGSGIQELITSVKELCENARWVASESVLESPPVRSGTLGSASRCVAESWFPGILGTETYALPVAERLWNISNWKRSLPHPDLKKVKSSVVKFLELTGSEFPAPKRYRELASDWVQSWCLRTEPEDFKEFVPVTSFGPSGCREASRRSGGKNYWWMTEFESLVSSYRSDQTLSDLITSSRVGTIDRIILIHAALTKPITRMGIPGGPLILSEYEVSFHPRFGDRDYADLIVSFRGDNDDEAASRYLEIMGAQVPDSESVLYDSTICPVLERGGKVRIVTTTSVIVSGLLHYLRTTFYRFLEQDPECIVMFRGYSSKSLADWIKRWRRRVDHAPGRKALSVDLTSATDTFSRCLVSDMCQSFVTYIIDRRPDLRYLKYIAPLSVCKQFYRYEHETKEESFKVSGIGLRGTPMGNPANWALLELLNEFNCCLGLQLSRVALRPGPVSIEEADLELIQRPFQAPENSGCASCGDDQIQIRRSRRSFRCYEQAISKWAGGIISSGSHFESRSFAIFTETPYSLSPRGDLWYSESIKVKMLVSPEFRFPGAKELPAKFLWGETFSKSLYWFKWTESQRQVSQNLKWLIVKREGDLMVQLSTLGLSPHLPKAFGGWGFDSPTGRVHIGHLQRRALKVILRDDRSLRNYFFGRSFGNVWSLGGSRRSTEVLDILLETFVLYVEDLTVELRGIISQASLVPYPDWRKLRTFAPSEYMVAEEAYEHVFSRLCSLSARFIPSNLLNDPSESLNLHVVSKRMSRICDKVLKEDRRNYEYAPLRVYDDLPLVTSLEDRMAWKGSQLLLERSLVLGLTEALSSVLAKGTLSRTWTSDLDRRYFPGMVLEEFLFQARISQAISLPALRAFVSKVEHMT